MCSNANRLHSPPLIEDPTVQTYIQQSAHLFCQKGFPFRLNLVMSILSAARTPKNLIRFALSKNMIIENILCKYIILFANDVEDFAHLVHVNVVIAIGGRRSLIDRGSS